MRKKTGHGIGGVAEPDWRTSVGPEDREANTKKKPKVKPKLKGTGG